MSAASDQVQLFLALLGTLPTFDTAKPTSARQGDQAVVQEATRAWRALRGELGDDESKLLGKVYGDLRWRNYRRLLSHSSTAISQRRQRDSQRYSTAAARGARNASARRVRAHEWFKKAWPALAVEVQKLGIAEVHEHVFDRIARRFPDEAEAAYVLVQIRAAIIARSPLLPALHRRLQEVAPNHAFADAAGLERARERILALEAERSAQTPQDAWSTAQPQHAAEVH